MSCTVRKICLQVANAIDPYIDICEGALSRTSYGYPGNHMRHCYYKLNKTYSEHCKLRPELEVHNTELPKRNGRESTCSLFSTRLIEWQIDT